MKRRTSDNARPDTPLSRCMVAAGLLGASLGMTIPAQAKPENPPPAAERPSKVDGKHPAAPAAAPSRQLKLTAPKLPDGTSRQIKFGYDPLPGSPEVAPVTNRKPAPALPPREPVLPR